MTTAPTNAGAAGSAEIKSITRSTPCASTQTPGDNSEADADVFPARAMPAQPECTSALATAVDVDEEALNDDGDDDDAPSPLYRVERIPRHVYYARNILYQLFIGSMSHLMVSADPL